MKTKGGPQYVVSAIFLMEFGDGKIRTSNPQFFTTVRSLALYTTLESNAGGGILHLRYKINITMIYYYSRIPIGWSFTFICIEWIISGEFKT
jgi:hypothetical protein